MSSLKVPPPEFNEGELPAPPLEKKDLEEPKEEPKEEPNYIRTKPLRPYHPSRYEIAWSTNVDQTPWEERGDKLRKMFGVRTKRNKKENKIIDDREKASNETYEKETKYYEKKLEAYNAYEKALNEGKTQQEADAIYDNIAKQDTNGGKKKRKTKRKSLKKKRKTKRRKSMKKKQRKTKRKGRR